MAKVLLGTSAGNGNSALQDWSGLLSLRLTVGPAAYIVLTVMVLQHPVLSNHAIALTGDVFLGLSVAGLANVLAFLGLALLYAWRRIVFHGLRYQAIVAVLLVAGIVGEFALSAAGEGVLVPMVAANVLSGVGLACLAVGQVRLFAGAPSRQAAANLFVGMFGAALVIALAAVLDSLLSLLVCLLLVGVSFAALGAESGRGAAARYGEKTPLAIPWKLVATLAVQGLSTGFVQKSGVLASQEGFFLAEGIAFALADILALVFLWRLNRDFNHLLYVIAFPLLALGHLAMVLMGETLGAVVVHEIGYRFIMFLSWMLAAWVIKHKELSANWVWPCIMCAFVGGRVAGMACGTLLGSIGGADGAAAAQMVAVFVVLFSALLLFGGAGVGDGWGMSRAATDGENAPGERFGGGRRRRCPRVRVDAPGDGDRLAARARARPGLHCRISAYFGGYGEDPSPQYLSQTRHSLPSGAADPSGGRPSDAGRRRFPQDRRRRANAARLEDRRAFKSAMP